jgi:hypothetical protein
MSRNDRRKSYGSQLSPTFSFVQGSLQSDWKDRLSNEVDGVTGQQGCFSRLVQVGAKKDVAQCLTCIKLPSGVDTAAAPAKRMSIRTTSGLSAAARAMASAADDTTAQTS